MRKGPIVVIGLFLQKYAHGGVTFRDYLSSKYYIRAYILQNIMTRGCSGRGKGTRSHSATIFGYASDFTFLFLITHTIFISLMNVN